MTELTAGLVCACLPSVNLLRERCRKRSPRALRRRAGLRPPGMGRFKQKPHAQGGGNTGAAHRSQRFAWPSPGSHAELAMLNADSASDGGHTRPGTTVSIEGPELWRALDAGEVNAYGIRRTMAMPVETPQRNPGEGGDDGDDDSNGGPGPHRPERDGRA